MTPSASYRLADGPADFRRAHALCDALGMERVTFGWPTVVAEKDGEIIGVMATRPSDKAVLVGRLAAKGQNPSFTLIRLVDAYENVLRLAGVKVYLIPTQREDERLQVAIERLMDIRPWVRDEKVVWYRREIPRPLRKAG